MSQLIEEEEECDEITRIEKEQIIARNKKNEAKKYFIKWIFYSILLWVIAIGSQFVFKPAKHIDEFIPFRPRSILNITDNNFDTYVLNNTFNSSKWVLLFSIPTCESCQIITESIKRELRFLIPLNYSVNFGIVETENNQEICGRFNIFLVPHILLIENSKVFPFAINSSFVLKDLYSFIIRHKNDDEGFPIPSEINCYKLLFFQLKEIYIIIKIKIEMNLQDKGYNINIDDKTLLFCIGIIFMFLLYILIKFFEQMIKFYDFISKKFKKK